MKHIAIVVVALAAAIAVSSASARPALTCDIRARVNGDLYHGYVERTWHTSCPFARNVFLASMRYITSAGGEGDGDFYVSAWSPVTHKTYRTHCFAHGDLYDFGINVDCRAGIGARVIYRAFHS